MPLPVGTANVHIRPSFVNFTKTISREIRKSMPQISREAGSLGKAMGQGFSSESDGIAKEAQELSTKVAQAKEESAKASKAHAVALDKEAKLIGDLKVAEQRLVEVQSSSTAKQSTLIKAQEAVAQTKRKLAVATAETAGAYERMTAASVKLSKSQGDLDVALKKANGELDVYHKKHGSITSFNISRAFQELRGSISSAGDGLGRLGAGLANLAPRAMSGLGSISTGLLKVAGAGAMASGAVAGIGALGTAVAGAVGPLASLTASLAPIGGLALTLPALGAGAVAAFGVLGVALADAENRLAHLGPRFQALGTSIQDAFWSYGVPAVNQMVNALWPVATTVLPQIAAAFGTWSAGIANVVTSGPGMDNIRVLLVNVREAVIGAKDGVKGFVSGLLSLAGAGSAYFPVLAQGFTNLGTQFAAWSARITSDGSFQTYVSRAMSVLGALTTTVVSIVGIFGSIGTAAMNAGHLTIQGLAGALSQVNAALKTAEWQAKLTTFFQVTNAGVATMSAAFGGLFTQIGSMGTIVTLLMTSSTQAVALLVNGITAALAAVPVQNNLTTFLQNLPVLAQHAGALMTPLLTLLTAGLSLAGQTATAVAPALGALLTPLSGALMLAMPHLQRLVTVLGTQLTNAARIVAPIFGMFVNSALMPMIQIVSQLLPLLSPIATLLMSALGPAFQLLGTVMNGAVGVVKVLVSALSGIITAITPIVSTVLGSLIPAFQTVANMVFPALIAAVQRMAPAFIGLINQIRPIVTFLMSALAPAFQFVAQIVGAVMVQFIGHVAGAVTNIIGVLSGMINFVRAVLTGNWSAAWNAMKQIVSSALGAVWNIVNAILIGRVLGLMRSAVALMPQLFTGGFSLVKSVVSGGMNFIKSVISSGMKAVHSVFSSTWNAIKSVVSSVITAIKSVISSGMNSAKTVVTNALNAIKTGFVNGMNNVKSTVKSGISNVVGFFRELPGKVTSALSGMAGKLRSIGSDMMRGLVNGIKGGAGAVIDAIGGAASAAINKAKSILGIHSPSRVFRDEVGEMIPAGIGVGISRNARAAIKPVGALAAGLASAAQGVAVPSINSRVSSSLASYRSGSSLPSSNDWRAVTSLGASRSGGDHYEILVPELKATGEDVASALAYHKRINNRR